MDNEVATYNGTYANIQYYILVTLPFYNVGFFKYIDETIHCWSFMTQITIPCNIQTTIWINSFENCKLMWLKFHMDILTHKNIFNLTYDCIKDIIIITALSTYYIQVITVITSQSFRMFWNMK
jgi:hypothetical protein